MTFRNRRWPTIFDDHRAELMHSAFRTWRTCVPAMTSLATESPDYRVVARLQAETVAFSEGISGGTAWISAGTTPRPPLPTVREGREAEVDEMLAACEGDARIAIRTLLDVVRRIDDEVDQG